MSTVCYDCSKEQKRKSRKLEGAWALARQAEAGGWALCSEKRGHCGASAMVELHWCLISSGSVTQGRVRYQKARLALKSGKVIFFFLNLYSLNKFFSDSLAKSEPETLALFAGQLMWQRADRCPWQWPQRKSVQGGTKLTSAFISCCTKCSPNSLHNSILSPFMMPLLREILWAMETWSHCKLYSQWGCQVQPVS